MADDNLSVEQMADDNLSVEQMGEARTTRLLIHEVRYVQGTKLVKLTYRPVFVSFRKIAIPSGENSRSKNSSSKGSNSIW